MENEFEDFELTEVLMSAQYNLETLAKQNPQLNGHPSFAIAKSQIDNSVLFLMKQEQQAIDEV